MKSDTKMDYLKKFIVNILSIKEDEIIPTSSRYAICADLSQSKILNYGREKFVNSTIEGLRTVTFIASSSSLYDMRNRQLGETGYGSVFVETNSDIFEFLNESFSILNSNYEIVQIPKEKNTIYVPIIYHLGKDFCSLNFVRGGEYKFEFLDEDFAPIQLSSGEVEFYKDILTPKYSVYAASESDFDEFCKNTNLNYSAIKIDSNLQMEQILDHICENFRNEPMNQCLPSNTFAFTFCGRTAIRSI